MNRRQVVISDDEADESLPTTKGGLSKQNLQRRQKKANEGSPEEMQEVAASTGTQVKDLVRLLHVALTCYITVEVERRLKDTTKDIRVCGKNGEGSHPFTNTSVDGWFCKFCL